VVGAAPLDSQLGHWAERFDPVPDVLRVETDHDGLLRRPFADEIAAAVVRSVRSS
jgi:hypothetical protein